MTIKPILLIICASLISASFSANAAIITPDDFGPYAIIEEYENLGLPQFNLPTVIRGHEYSSTNSSKLDYRKNTCVSGFCMQTFSVNSATRIDFNSSVNRAGIYIFSGLFQPEIFTAFDADGNIIEETSNGTYIPLYDAYFYGIEGTGNEIAAIRFVIRNGQSVSSFDNLMTETVSAIPVPSAIWLFASGLISLIGAIRIKA